MNTDDANKYLNERQIYQRDVYDSKDIEHPLECLLEDYHQEQLKLLGIADVVGQSEQLLALAQYMCQHQNNLDGKTAKDYLQDFLSQ